MLAKNTLENNNIIDKFTDLGGNIRKSWAKYQYNEDGLVETAINELTKTKIEQYFSYDDLIEYATNPDPSMAVHQIDSPFGDLQQILYRDSRFYIEALYWCDGSTAIHDHGFSGAFYVMSGSSINLEYQFNFKDKINHHFWFGELSQPKVSQLDVGSVKPIYSGKRFIHSVFHLENPTISIVVRTYHDDDAMPQFEYRGNHIGLVEEFSPELAKKIQGLRFRAQSNAGQFAHIFKNIYINSPSDERYWLIRAFYSNFVNQQALWDFLNNLNDDKTQIILETVKQEAILHKTMQLRNKIEDAEVRYFLALLLNIPNWEGIISYIKTNYKNNVDDVINSVFAYLRMKGYQLPHISDNKIVLSGTLNEHVTMNNVLYHLITKKFEQNYAR